MTGDSPRISKGSYCLTWDGFQSVAPSPQSQDSRCSAVEDRQRSGSNQLVQPLNLWSPKSPDKNLSWGVLKLVVEIGGPICCPKHQRASDFNIGPNFEGVQSTNKIALPNLKLPPEEKNWSSNQTDERRFVFITTHGGRLPLAEFASWADAGDDDDGPTVVFLELGLRCFFFYFDILAKFFLRQEFFILYLWVFWVVVVSTVLFMCLFFKIFRLYLRKGFNLTTDWYFSIGWLNHRLVGPSLDVTVGFDDWLFGSRVCNPLRPTRGLPIVC